jgi:hypothetical protein
MEEGQEALGQDPGLCAPRNGVGHSVIWFFGLIAGAKEQLLKLDLLPALVAVFMVGFGADQIKNPRIC